MKQISITEFQKQTLKILEEVQRTRTPVVVVQDGQPLVQPNPVDNEESWIGKLAGTLIITGDIVAPVAEGDWEANT